MPVVAIAGGFRILIRFRDHAPPHVHVVGQGFDVLVYLGTLITVSDAPDQIRREAAKMVRDHDELCWRRWREIHGEAKR